MIKPSPEQVRRFPADSRREAYLSGEMIGAHCWEELLRFHVILFNSVSNTSRVRLVGGKMDVIIAASSASDSCSILRAMPSLRTESKAEGNVHALVSIPELDAERTFESRIELEYVTSHRSFELDKTAPLVALAQSNDSYCKNDKFWETKDPLIKRTSERIRGSSRDIGEFLSGVFAWVRDNVKLRDPQPNRLGAARAIRELIGDCDEMSDLFIALCRAANVPSRRVVGLFYHGRKTEPRPFDWHAWAEVQVSEGVWIPFDPSLNYFAAISEMHLPRCCMGRRSDYPLRRLTWRSHPDKFPTLNDDDVETITVLPN